MMQKEFKLPLEKHIYHREKTKQYRLEHPEARRRANIQQRLYVQKHREENVGKKILAVKYIINMTL